MAISLPDDIAASLAALVRAAHLVCVRLRRDFDWSNAKAAWTAQSPMDCEERLVEQARVIKVISPETKVFVYRNLVKALPWYTNVRAKLTDLDFAAWFLKFKPGGSLPNGTYHVPRCTKSVVPGGATKCSDHYHDQEQTPQGALPPPPPPPPLDGWGILEPGKIPQPAPNNATVWNVYQTTDDDRYENCAAAAAAAVGKGGGAARYFSWWGHVDDPSSNVTVFRCWLSSQTGWDKGYVPAVARVVSGFRGVPRPSKQVAWGDGVCPGDCDCGVGLPCGEYLCAQQQDAAARSHDCSKRAKHWSARQGGAS
eukprot:COSAG03_NODE_1657_length_3709_cov_5.853740_3_plen_310_part_00